METIKGFLDELPTCFFTFTSEGEIQEEETPTVEIGANYQWGMDYWY